MGKMTIYFRGGRNWWKTWPGQRERKSRRSQATRRKRKIVPTAFVLLGWHWRSNVPAFWEIAITVAVWFMPPAPGRFCWTERIFRFIDNETNWLPPGVTFQFLRIDNKRRSNHAVWKEQKHRIAPGMLRRAYQIVLLTPETLLATKCESSSHPSQSLKESSKSPSLFAFMDLNFSKPTWINQFQPFPRVRTESKNNISVSENQH